MKEKKEQINELFIEFVNKENELRTLIISEMERIMVECKLYTFEIPYTINGEEIEYVTYDNRNKGLFFENKYFNFLSEEVDTKTLQAMLNELYEYHD